jgi:hypothetical protein
MKKVTVLLGLFGVLFSGPVHAGYFTDLFKISPRGIQIQILEFVKQDNPGLWTTFAINQLPDAQLSNLAHALDVANETKNSLVPRTILDVQTANSAAAFTDGYKTIQNILDTQGTPQGEKYKFLLQDIHANVKLTKFFLPNLWKNYWDTYARKEIKSQLDADLQLHAMGTLSQGTFLRYYSNASKVVYALIPYRTEEYFHIIATNINYLAALQNVLHDRLQDPFLAGFEDTVQEIVKTVRTQSDELAFFSSNVSEARSFTPIQKQELLKIEDLSKSLQKVRHRLSQIALIHMGTQEDLAKFNQTLTQYMSNMATHLKEANYARFEVAKLMATAPILAATDCSTKLRGHTHLPAGPNTMNRANHQHMHPSFGGGI